MDPFKKKKKYLRITIILLLIMCFVQLKKLKNRIRLKKNQKKWTKIFKRNLRKKSVN